MSVYRVEFYKTRMAEYLRDFQQRMILRSASSI